MSPNTSASSSWSEDQPVVELRNVNVIHTSRTGGLFHPDTVHAVNDVSLSVKRGETLGLVGESGMRQVHHRPSHGGAAAGHLR